MAPTLSRLGRFAYRRGRTRVLVSWALVIVLMGVGTMTLSGTMSDSFAVPGTESQEAIDLLSERMPQAGVDGATARVVFVADHGSAVTDPATSAAIGDAVTALAGLPSVVAVNDPLSTGAISRDASTAYANVTYGVPSSELTEADREALLAAGEPAASAGLTVEFGGTASEPPVETGASEAIGLAVAAVVLFLTLGSVVAAGLPLLTALVGVGLGVMGITIASGFVDLSETVLTLSVMLGLAVAIDYALLIVSRYRDKLRDGRDGEEAAGRAVGTAGSAVVFAGATVVIALASLSVVGIPFLTAMGLAAAFTVFLSVVIALTLVPAMLGLLGHRVLGRRGRTSPDAHSDTVPRSLGARWARAIVRRRMPVAVAVVLVLGIVAIPALDLQLGMPSDATASPDTTQRRAYDAIAEGFGPGVNGPLVIVADLADVTDPDAAAQAVATDLAAVDGVVHVTPAVVTPAGDTALYTVIPHSGPSDPATEELVHELREQSSGWREKTGASVQVTGATAVQIDVSGALRGAMVPYLAVVVGLAFALLTLVFRSLVVPLKATLGFLLSVAATFGAVVAVFQWGWLQGLVGLDTTGPVLSFLPIFLIGILFGLAMDYEVFLVTRMREQYIHGASADEAVVHGFSHGARVVTAAGIIMLSVFAGFVLTPAPMTKAMGFALAIGVLIDAFLVRMTLVPAVMSLLGDRSWSLPGWLDQVLPNVDVEGEKLTRTPASSPHQLVDAAG